VRKRLKKGNFWRSEAVHGAAGSKRAPLIAPLRRFAMVKQQMVKDLIAPFR
jgi:hypothetical protein